MTLVAPLPTVQFRDTNERFTVRRIFCVAKNYAAHAREMGDDPERTAPSFFDKPVSALLGDGNVLPYPRETRELHHEVELVLAVGRSCGGPIEPADAAGLVVGAACGIDLTRRVLQREAKARGGPWDLAKGFRGSAPVGLLVAAPSLEFRGRIELRVNGTLRQASSLEHMIWSPAEVLAQLSRYEDLEAGDLIFTGTPEGVGPLERGDRLHGWVEHVGELSLTID